jgi:hypothetical protein
MSRADLSDVTTNRSSSLQAAGRQSWLLAYAALFRLSVAGDGLAFERRAPAAGRLAAARPFRLAAARPFAPNFGRNPGSAAHRPFPGEAGFTGIPPRGETRFISNEVVLHAPSNVSAQAVDAAARRLGLVAVSSQNLTLSGGTLFHFRIDNGRQVSDVVREFEAENIGVAQPNYIYRLQYDTRTPLDLPPLPAKKTPREAGPSLKKCVCVQKTRKQIIGKCGRGAAEPAYASPRRCPLAKRSRSPICTAVRRHGRTR